MGSGGGHICVVQHVVHEKRLVVFDASYHDPQVIIPFAGHGVALHYFGSTGHKSFEVFAHRGCVRLQADLQHDADATPDPGRVHKPNTVRENARLLEQPDPSPTRRGRRPDLFGDGRMAQAGIRLEKPQNSPVRLIEI